MIAYKFLRADGHSRFTGFTWPLPDGSGPGPWVAAPVDPCRSGVHACRARDLPYWTSAALFEVELEGPVLEQPTKVVAARGRLLRALDAWEADVRDAYCRWCVERARELAREDMSAWVAGIEPEYGNPATFGFIAARLAEARAGAAGYAAERERQAVWLADALGLEP